jgi:hypothetical protein
VTNNGDRSEIIKAYLRRLGNPYASLQIGDDVEGVEATKSPRDEQRLYVRHPYALIPQAEEAQETASDVVAKLPVSPTGGTLSKAEFRSGCRRIFGQYIPALEKGRLRAHHRDFITRNESSSPARRHCLVKHLEKYDISKTQGFTAHFNRGEPLTDEKLKQIEHLADSED